MANTNSKPYKDGRTIRWILLKDSPLGSKTGDHRIEAVRCVPLEMVQADRSILQKTVIECELELTTKLKDQRIFQISLVKPTPWYDENRAVYIVQRFIRYHGTLPLELLDL